MRLLPSFLDKNLEKLLWVVHCLLMLMKTFMSSLILQREPLRVDGAQRQEWPQVSDCPTEGTFYGLKIHWYSDFILSTNKDFKQMSLKQIRALKLS